MDQEAPAPQVPLPKPPESQFFPNLAKRATRFAWISLGIALIGPIASLVWAVFLIKKLTGPGTGLAALALPYLLFYAYPLSLLCGIIALILGGKAKKIAKENDAKIVMASVANIIAVIDIIPLANMIVTGFAAPGVIALFSLGSFKQMGMACSLNPKYTGSDFIPVAIATLDHYTGALPYQNGVKLTGLLSGGTGNIGYVGGTEGNATSGTVILKLTDQSGNSVGVLADSYSYTNEILDRANLSSPVSLEGFYRYKNSDIQYVPAHTGYNNTNNQGPPAGFTSTTPVIDVTDVCDYYGNFKGASADSSDSMKKTLTLNNCINSRPAIPWSAAGPHGEQAGFVGKTFPVAGGTTETTTSSKNICLYWGDNIFTTSTKYALYRGFGGENMAFSSMQQIATFSSGASVYADTVSSSAVCYALEIMDGAGGDFHTQDVCFEPGSNTSASPLILPGSR